MTIRSRPTLVVFALVMASVLLAGCGLRDRSAGRDAGRAQKPEGRYASINGLNMYYEIHGTGRPLVLLHGALCT
ncbi:MAG: alpha/beta fold hydrolase, partial [bacterium]